MTKYTKRAALAITGHGASLGKPSKMPGFTTAISAAACKTGAKLAKLAGSVCAGCYAAKGNYLYPSVRLAHERRLAALGHPEWAAAMAFLIQRATDKGGEPYFRWHDSGDIQSADHLRRIFEVCRATPSVKHWLPTREVKMVREALAAEKCPANLNIRVSSFMVKSAPMRRLPEGTTTSTVSWGKAPVSCPAYQNEGKCGDCRRCWDKSASNVNYPLH